jgi:NADH-quinone oxidoreductase subunit L
MIVALLTAFYMFRVVFLAFFGPAHAQGGGHDHGHGHAHEPPPSMLVPLWTLALLSMAVGIYFTFEHGEPEFVSPGWLTPAAVGAAVGGILLAWLTYQQRSIDAESLARTMGPIRRAAHARFWIDDLFEGVFGAAMLGLSRIVGWLDRYLVDGVLNVLSAWTVTSGDRLRLMQTGRAQDYLYGIAVGVLVVILWMRWVLA